MKDDKQSPPSDSVRDAAGHNPYASPPAVESPESKDPLIKNTGVVARIIFGLWAGVLFGGTFGAGGSVVLGFTNGAVLGWNSVGPGIDSVQQFIFTEIVAAIAGAIMGLFGGGLIGPIVSVISCIGNTHRRSVIWSSVTLSMVSGSAIGLFGSWVLNRQTIADWRSALLGVVIGSIFGMLGGFQLGRGIISFAHGEIS